MNLNDVMIKHLKIIDIMEIQCLWDPIIGIFAIIITYYLFSNLFDLMRKFIDQKSLFKLSVTVDLISI